MIGIGQGREDESSVAGMLRGCHRRIRHFAALATRLAASPDAPRAELADAAAAVHRYFTIALPHHHADEETSLRPRLSQRSELARSFETMAEQHLDLDVRLARLVPLWARLAREPGAASDLTAALVDATAGFESACETHLALEEAGILPAVESLSPADAAPILAEMRARRA